MPVGEFRYNRGCFFHSIFSKMLIQKDIRGDRSPQLIHVLMYIREKMPGKIICIKNILACLCDCCIVCVCTTPLLSLRECCRYSCELLIWSGLSIFCPINNVGSVNKDSALLLYLAVQFLQQHINNSSWYSNTIPIPIPTNKYNYKQR